MHKLSHIIFCKYVCFHDHVGLVTIHKFWTLVTLDFIMGNIGLIDKLVGTGKVQALEIKHKKLP